MCQRLQIGREKTRHVVSRGGQEVVVVDLLNFAVARTHLLKIITPELQAIQTLYRDVSVLQLVLCRAHHHGHSHRRVKKKVAVGLVQY